MAKQYLYELWYLRFYFIVNGNVILDYCDDDDDNDKDSLVRCCVRILVYIV